jgi:hypothetical protein
MIKCAYLIVLLTIVGGLLSCSDVVKLDQDDLDNTAYDYLSPFTEAFGNRKKAELNLDSGVLELRYQYNGSLEEIKNISKENEWDVKTEKENVLIITRTEKNTEISIWIKFEDGFVKMASSKKFM